MQNRQESGVDKVGQMLIPHIRLSALFRRLVASLDVAVGTL